MTSGWLAAKSVMDHAGYHYLLGSLLSKKEIGESRQVKRRFPDSGNSRHALARRSDRRDTRSVVFQHTGLRDRSDIGNVRNPCMPLTQDRSCLHQYIMDDYGPRDLVGYGPNTPE